MRVFAALLVCAFSQTLAPWPTAFSVRFTASVFNSTPLVTVAGSPAVMFYDYNHRSQRLSFAAGCKQRKCSIRHSRHTPAGPVDISNGACDFVFNATSGYLITHSDGQCCRQAAVGPPRPDWVSNLQFVDTAFVYGEKTLHFRGGTPKHNYYVRPNAQQSAALLVVEDIYEVWQFLEDFHIGPQDPGLFALPGNCSNTCSNTLMMMPRFVLQ
jgi:hypothetical protein